MTSHTPRPGTDWLIVLLAVAVLCPPLVQAQTRIRIVPPDRTTVAVGQLFDVRVEATAGPGAAVTAPRGLVVKLDDEDVSARNVLPQPPDGERGEGGLGTDEGTPDGLVAPAPANTTNFLWRGVRLEHAGRHVITATTSDGATATVAIEAQDWSGGEVATAARARNVILLLGDGMGAAHRTAARVLARGVSSGKARAPLAMDRMPVTGQVITFSLNSVITDSAPGMSSYVTGSKHANNQEGVFPDNTAYAFDNPRVEYLGEMLRRVRGKGFNVGIVTTSDVTDATPAANAVHTSARSASLEIARRLYDERERNAVTVLMGGGRASFQPESQGGARTDERDLVEEYRAAGFTYVPTNRALSALAAGPPPAALLGLFHRSHMAVAFDKVGAGRYSTELPVDPASPLRDQPMLDAMARAALRTLSAASPKGFYLMIEGASIDKQAHAVDAERTIWDTIEFDNAVAVALEFAEGTNADADPDNDTLVVVTADHECGGLGLIGVGNERYAPEALGRAVRDYSAVFRFAPEQVLDFVPNYDPDEHGFPRDPDPSRKLLLGWAAGPDRFENWISNRRALPPAVDVTVIGEHGVTRGAIANEARDGDGAQSDNLTVGGRRVPGFLVPGSIENGAEACTDASPCPGDTSSVGHTIAGHTASDIPLSAYGPGMWQFSGTYENTDVFFKLLRATTGAYRTPGTLLPAGR